jgi:hypothetical protein
MYDFFVFMFKINDLIIVLKFKKYLHQNVRSLP